jgi:serine/threonine protein kinase
MTEQCGTPAYIAPEIIKEDGYEGFGVDIWSAGVVLYAMLYGSVPFKAGSMKELHQIILKGRFTMKEDVSEEARDLLTKILQSDPRQRLSEQAILSHPWMQSSNISSDMFTPEEREFIEKEFCYSKKLKIPNCTDTESEIFTELNIDTTQNELLKNASTKSLILAPFNSSQTNMHINPEKEAIVLPKKAIKFNPLVKDLDRQYEKNNNCELDNGVYNKMICDSESKKSGTFDMLDSFKGVNSPEVANNADKKVLNPPEYVKQVVAKIEISI